VIFSGVRATKSALVGVSLLSAADVAAFDFFCAEFGQGQKTIRFARLSGKAVIFTALKSLRRSAANARNHWHDSLRNTDENHTRHSGLYTASVPPFDIANSNYETHPHHRRHRTRPFRKPPR
jgi:hypothetical protein